MNFLVLFSFHTSTSLEFTLFNGVANISSHVFCAKVASTFPRSHCLVSSSMSSQTRIFSVGSRKKIGVWGSQTCVATSMVRPSPTCHLDPSMMISLASSSDLHTKEGLGPSSAFRNELRGKYRALYTLWKRECVFWINLQACFASIARLKAFRSWNPIPPLHLWEHSLVQLIQWIFRSSWSCPYQYFAKRELMPSQIDLSSLNTPIEYVGMA